MSMVEIIEADLQCPEHQAATLKLLDAYARDRMGNGTSSECRVKR